VNQSPEDSQGGRPVNDGKFYVITHGPSQSYVSTVHTSDCPMFKRFRHAHVWDRDPRREDKFNKYHSCPRCTGKTENRRDRYDPSITISHHTGSEGSGESR